MIYHVCLLLVLRIAGDKARMFLKATVQKLEQTKSNLSASYIQLIAGLGMEFSHHSMQGR